MVSNFLLGPGNRDGCGSTLERKCLGSSTCSRGRKRCCRYIISSRSYGGVAFVLRSGIGMFVFSGSVGLVCHSSSRTKIADCFSECCSAAGAVTKASGGMVDLNLVSKGCCVIFGMGSTATAANCRCKCCTKRPLPVTRAAAFSSLARCAAVG